MTAELPDQVWTTENNVLRSGLLVARAIMPQRLEEMPVLVLNTSNKPRVVRVDAVLSSLTVAQCVEETKIEKDEGER